MAATKLSQKISLSFSPLDLVTAHPFGISSGTAVDSHNLLVELRHGEFIGYGEASPVFYHGESIESAAALLTAWQKEDLFGEDPFAIVDILRRLDRLISDNNSVKAAIEMALHDLCGKIAGQPTYKMLGLSRLPLPITDMTIGIDSLEMIERKTKEALEAGFKVLKIKQGTSFDREIIKSVRNVSKDIPLRVDANGAWTVKQAIANAHYLAQQNVQFIEQPIAKHSSVEDFKLLRSQSPLPIFADESCSTAKDVARLAGAVDGVVLKLAKSGGLLRALEVIHAARAHGMQLMFGCMLESSLGISAAAQLAGLVDFLDLDGALLLANDPFVGVEFKAGEFELPERPGLGAVPRNRS